MSIKMVPFLICHCLNTFLDYHIINEGQNIKEAILGAIIKNDHICSHINPWKLKFLSSINYMVIIIFPKFCNSSIDILSIRSKKLFWVVKICTAKKKHVHRIAHSSLNIFQQVLSPSSLLPHPSLQLLKTP